MKRWDEYSNREARAVLDGLLNVARSATGGDSLVGSLRRARGVGALIWRRRAFPGEFEGVRAASVVTLGRSVCPMFNHG